MAASTGVAAASGNSAVCSLRTADPKDLFAIVGLTLLDRDAEQPGFERPRIFVRPAVGPNGEKDFLKQLLALMVVADHPPDERQQPGRVAMDQGAQAFAPAERNLAHQPFVRPVVGLHT